MCVCVGRVHELLCVASMCAPVPAINRMTAKASEGLGCLWSVCAKPSALPMNSCMNPLINAQVRLQGLGASIASHTSHLLELLEFSMEAH